MGTRLKPRLCLSCTLSEITPNNHHEILENEALEILDWQQSNLNNCIYKHETIRMMILTVFQQVLSHLAHQW